MDTSDAYPGIPFSAILRGIADGVSVQDRTGRIVYINEAAARFVGVDPGDRAPEGLAGAIGRAFVILDEAGREVSVDELPSARVFDGEAQAEALLRFHRRATGEDLWTSVRSRPITDPSGGLAFVVSIFHDVTERRRTEAARLALAAIVESSVDAVVGMTLDGTIQSWNPGAERLYGYHADEMIGQPFTILLPPAEHERFFQVMDLLARDGHVDQFEWVRLTRDGRLLNVSVSMSVIRDVNRSVIGVSSIARDITEQKRVEATLRFLANASALLSSSLDYERILTRVARLAVPYLADWCAVDIVNDDGNVARLTVAHRDAEKETWAQQLHDRFPFDPEASFGVARVLRTTQPELYPEIADAQLAAMTHDHDRLAMLRAVGLRSLMIVPLAARGRTLGAITLAAAESGRRFTLADLDVAQDLARRAAVAVDNARLYREARAAARARDEFISVATHELKTPLTAVQGFAQLLQRLMDEPDLDRERASRVADQLAEHTARSVALVNDLLDVSRIQQGRLEMRPETVDLAALAQRVVSRFQGVPDWAETHRIVVDAPTEPIVGTWDPNLLDEVLTNLISNALKYSPDGGEVRVALRLEDADAEIAVSDSGIGMSEEEQLHLFQPFVRGATGRATAGGTGLGLYIAAQIVEQHGGRITVNSRLGEGSTFTVILPLRPQLDAGNHYARRPS